MSEEIDNTDLETDETRDQLECSNCGLDVDWDEDEIGRASCRERV